MSNFSLSQNAKTNNMGIKSFQGARKVTKKTTIAFKQILKLVIL